MPTRKKFGFSKVHNRKRKLAKTPSTLVDSTSKETAVSVVNEENVVNDVISVRSEVKGIKRTYETMNMSLTNAARSAGIGHEVTKRLCNYINLPSPTSKWVEYQSILSFAYKERAEMSMARAIDELKMGLGGDPKVIVSFDGTWMKRGRSSKVGVTLCINQYNKIIGVDMRFKYCPRCQRAGTCLRNCDINFGGPSGNMESMGAIEIVNTVASKHDLKVTHYLGDGDCRAFANVSKGVP